MIPTDLRRRAAVAPDVRCDRTGHIADVSVEPCLCHDGFVAPPLRPEKHLAGRIWLGLASVFVVLTAALVTSVTAMLSAFFALERMTDLSAAERHAVAIGVAAREQYRHLAHGVLLRETSHLGHEQHWAKMLTTHVETLRPTVGIEEGKLLSTIEGASLSMSRQFEKEVLPAALAGDTVRVREAHAAADVSLTAMVGASDSAIAHLSTKSKEASAAASQRVRVACWLAVVAVLLAALVALNLAESLARQVVVPIAQLNDASVRVGRGEFDTPIPAMDTAEFEGLAGNLRAMAAELHRREVEALESSRLAALGSLAAGVAHELNNPLGVMVGYLKRLRRAAESGPLAEELRIVDDEAHQCLRIVEDLVTVAREPRLEIATIDLADVVRQAAHRLASIPDLEGRRLVVEAHRTTPVRADAVRIGQVLRNLVLNAAAASHPEDPIEITVEATDDSVVLAVRDHGSGIAEQDLPHVFEPFYSRRSGGTGLGLAVSQRIVRGHGGSIDLVSGPDGTVVRVRLPARSGA